MKLLFLCTGNSCRSQMAEGWARQLLGAKVEVSSAGIESHGLNPHALAVMEEAGVSMQGHKSRTLEQLPSLDFDLVITVCAHAHESCPVFPGRARVIHHGFDDPPALARELAPGADPLPIYRRVRDEIRAYILSLPETCPEFFHKETA